MSRRSEWLALGVLLAAIGLLHGHGLSFGFFFDDSNHLELCAKNGYGDLAGGNRFDWTRSIARAWWLAEETGWAYFRPIPVAIRTACLQCFGLDPLPFHVVHLFLYSAVVLSFYGLLRRLGIGLKPALVGGLLFTLNPTHAVVSPWLANDTTILTALGYIWGIWLMRASADADHRRPLLALGACACYALTLLSRESGLMLGPILVMFDWLTLAPEPFAPRRMAEIHREGDRTLLVRMDGDGWFAGPFGEQVQLGWFGSSRSRLPNGFVNLWPGAGPMPFQVEVVEAGPRGIRALRFTFDKPLEDPSYRFFIGNPTHPAQQWHPSGMPTGRSQDPYTSVLNGRIQRMQMGVDFVDGWLASCP